MKTTKAKQTPQPEKPRKEGEWGHRPIYPGLDRQNHLILIGPDGIYAGYLSPECAEKACRAVNSHDELVQALGECMMRLHSFTINPPGSPRLGRRTDKILEDAAAIYDRARKPQNTKPAP